MHWFRRFAVALLLVLSTSLVFAKPSTEELAQRLKHADDFRVRVQAALELGKSMSLEAVEPLVAGLDDANASVRAASAAALKNLGDVRALAPLKEHRGDKSGAVRAQVAQSIKALEEQGASGPKARVLVKL
jgi:HEAT repeat protein